MRIDSTSLRQWMTTLGMLLAACLIWSGDLSTKSAAALAAGQTQADGPATPPNSVKGSDVPGQTNLPRSYLLRTQTNIVLVDARVTDKSGRPVEGLTKDNFRVLEDGKPQTITSLSMEDVDRLATASNENGPPAVIDLSKLPPNVAPAQVIQNHR